MKGQYNYSQEDLENLYKLPFFELIYRSHDLHRRHHNPNDIQKCSLLSIKTGGCPEDCSYCPQSAHYKTTTDREETLQLDEVKNAVKKAKEEGSKRFCMGAAWREVKDGPEFDRVLEMVKIIKDEGLEACATLGMLTNSQAQKLKTAGLDAYNHNIDTGRDYYKKIISTRTFDDRIQTIKTVREAGITVCSGGIVGMGETMSDRCAMIFELSSMDPPPESVPINLLIPVEGTPLGQTLPLDSFDLIRTIAIARLSMPKSRIRLSAGRLSLNREAQTLAFFSGANSIFLGETLLTRPNPSLDEDVKLFADLGISEETLHCMQ